MTTAFLYSFFIRQIGSSRSGAIWIHYSNILSFLRFEQFEFNAFYTRKCLHFRNTKNIFVLTSLCGIWNANLYNLAHILMPSKNYVIWAYHPYGIRFRWLHSITTLCQFQTNCNCFIDIYATDRINENGYNISGILRFYAFSFMCVCVRCSYLDRLWKCCYIVKLENVWPCSQF